MKDLKLTNYIGIKQPEAIQEFYNLMAETEKNLGIKLGVTSFFVYLLKQYRNNIEN